MTNASQKTMKELLIKKTKILLTLIKDSMGFYLCHNYGLLVLFFLIDVILKHLNAEKMLKL